MATVIEILTILETRMNMLVNRELKNFQHIDQLKLMEYSTPLNDLSAADLDDQLFEITDMHEEFARKNIYTQRRMYDMSIALSNVQGNTQHRRRFRNKKES